MAFSDEDKILMKCLRESKNMVLNVCLKCSLIDNGACKPDNDYHVNRVTS